MCGFIISGMIFGCRTPKVIVTKNWQEPPPIDVDCDKTDSLTSDIAEQFPEFPGGSDSFTKTIKANIQYPDNAKKLRLEGTIGVTFIVEKDGSVCHVKTVGNIFDNGCALEAMRVIKSLPKFIPGKQKGKPVRVRMVVPVKFKLD